MKPILIVLFLFAFVACKEAPKEMISHSQAPEAMTKIDISKYPEALQNIFKAHGGLDAWKTKRVLSYEMPKPKNSEKHTIDLYTRDEKIETDNFSMGSDGAEIWLDDENGNYKGNAVFYHNLMFYFYAMPFVLADDGIIYSETEALEYEGKSYPGIRISYNDGVGISSKDEYFIHYNPDTFQMTWLGYTVTFKSGEKSDNVKWIRYNDWMTVDGLQLPQSLTWHEYEGRTIKGPRPPRKFENVSLSEKALAADFFKQPEGAKIVNQITE